MVGPLYYAVAFISILCVLIYFLLIRLFSRTWSSIIETRTDGVSSSHKFSIIISFRNEGNNLSDLLQDLTNLDYPATSYEVIFVDDHSSDSGFRLVASTIRSLPNFSLVKSEGAGKKQAFLTGIKRSKFDCILTTDADCRILPGWLSSFAAKYKTDDFEMVLGPVLPLDPISLFERFQSLEFLSLIGSAAGAAESGHAIMCNGANLSYKKTALPDMENALACDLVSGDDVFLMLRIKKNDPKKIGFLKSNAAAVRTKMQPSMHGFIGQRIRWASKSRFYFDVDVSGTAFLVWLTNGMILVSLFLCITSLWYLVPFFGLVAIKSLIDYTFLRKITSFFKADDYLRYFISSVAVYPFYVVFTGLAGMFANSIQWKGRTHKAHRK